MYVLGLVAQYHDAACALIKDGNVIAAIEEERLNRIKHCGGFPKLAMEYCLNQAGIGLEDVAYVGYYFRPIKRLLGVMYSSACWTRDLTGFYKSQSFIERSFKQYKRSVAIGKFLTGFNGKFHFLEHHNCHAASSYYVSDFNRSAILTVDATGEMASTQMALGEGSRMKIIDRINQPHSLGYLYAAVTTYLGFKRNSDEYKVMGLAPYGRPRFLDKFREIVRLKDRGRFEISDMSYFTPPSPPSEIKRVSSKFCKEFGPPRDKGTEINERHADIARSLQAVLEETLVHICKYLHDVTNTENLCMAGGVALNCVANAKILENTKFKNLYIHPAANDPGCSIGAAKYIYHHILGKEKTAPLVSPYLGPEYEDQEILRALELSGLKFSRCNDVEKKAAELIAQGRIIGWFQGKMEWGPRALGNRSILADARRPGMKDRVNMLVKMREPFRPFAPAVLSEYSKEYFQFDGESPYMLLAVKANPDKQHIIPAVVHVDGTCRIQTVNSVINPRFYSLIKWFHQLTGVPVILNTSFNVQGEPIVCNPTDAIRCYKSCGLDDLVIGDYLVEKSSA